MASWTHFSRIIVRFKRVKATTCVTRLAVVIRRSYAVKLSAAVQLVWTSPTRRTGYKGRWDFHLIFADEGAHGLAFAQAQDTNRRSGSLALALPEREGMGVQTNDRTAQRAASAATNEAYSIHYLTQASQSERCAVCLRFFCHVSVQDCLLYYSNEA
eukprot:6209709-Pleurochrysis_carterae.AAC.3